MLALVSEFNFFLRSRCSLEMWCPDDIGRDSWDWVGPEGPRLLTRSLPRLYYCCCCVVLCCVVLCCVVLCCVVLCWLFCFCFCIFSLLLHVSQKRRAKVSTVRQLAHKQTTSRSGHALLTHRDERLETHNTELSVLISRRMISGAKHVFQTHAVRTDVVSDSLNYAEQMVEFLRSLHVALLESHEFRIHSALVLSSISMHLLSTDLIEDPPSSKSASSSFNCSISVSSLASNCPVRGWSRYRAARRKSQSSSLAFSCFAASAGCFEMARQPFRPAASRGPSLSRPG